MVSHFTKARKLSPLNDPRRPLPAKRSANLHDWLLCAPALGAIVLGTVYPVLRALWLSLPPHDARFATPVAATGYDTLIMNLNLGLGAAVSVLAFLCALGLAVLFLRGFGTSSGSDTDSR